MKVLTKSISRILGVALIGLFFSLPVKTQTASLPAGAAISPARDLARTMYARLGGVILPIDDPNLTQMENFILAGNPVGAAQIASQSPGFYNVVLRNVVAPQSDVNQLINIPLNDFIATYIGLVKNDGDARELLTGNYIYVANPAALPAGLTVRSDPVKDILISNNHFQDLDGQDLSSVLMKSTQMSLNSAGAAVVNPEPVGLITTRAWGSNFMNGGTNRRNVKNVLDALLCSPIQSVADPTMPDNWVSQDVNRFPQGDNLVFEATCKGCHGALDGLRPAFGHFDFSSTYVQNSLVLTAGKAANQFNSNPATSLTAKFYINNTIFPAGFVVPNTNWVNNLVGQNNPSIFGWRGNMSGTGIQSFASMIAASKAYSQCIVRRAFQSVCNRPPVASETPLIASLASQMESDKYNVRHAYEQVAASPACLGN